MQDVLWHNLWSADNPVVVSNEHLLVLVECSVPTKVIRVSNKDHPWFDFNAGMLLASSKRLNFVGPVIVLGLTVKSLFTVK